MNACDLNVNILTREKVQTLAIIWRKWRMISCSLKFGCISKNDKFLWICSVDVNNRIMLHVSVHLFLYQSNIKKKDSSHNYTSVNPFNNFMLDLLFCVIKVVWDTLQCFQGLQKMITTTVLKKIKIYNIFPKNPQER